MIVISYTSATGVWTKDTSLLINGNFKFEGTINEPNKAYLTGKYKSIDFNSVNTVSIFLEPGNIYVELTEDNYAYAKVTGSKTQHENDQFTFALDSINRKYKSYLDQHLQLKYKYVQAKTDSEKEAALKEQSAPKLSVGLNSLHNEIFNLQISFLLNHPDSYVSPQFIYSAANSLTIDSAITLFHTLTPRIQNSNVGKYIAHYLKIKAQNTIGKTAYDFNAQDIHGSAITLSQFRGRYVLLDFWASWCVPCIKLFPQTKELYQQYHPRGFEVVAISIDEDTVAWRNSVKQHQLTMWYHLVANKDIQNNYPNVANPIPSAILIGPDGRIIWNSNDERRLEEVLAGIMME